MSIPSNNPAGRNGYPVIRTTIQFFFCEHFNEFSLARVDDETLREALTRFHRQKLTNNTRISALLKTEYNIEMRSVHNLLAVSD
jgi:hypothetical protein